MDIIVLHYTSYCVKMAKNIKKYKKERIMSMDKASFDKIKGKTVSSLNDDELKEVFDFLEELFAGDNDEFCSISEDDYCDNCGQCTEDDVECDTCSELLLRMAYLDGQVDAFKYVLADKTVV